MYAIRSYYVVTGVDDADAREPVNPCHEIPGEVCPVEDVLGALVRKEASPNGIRLDEKGKGFLIGLRNNFV